MLGLFTDEPLYAGATVIPKGVRLPVDFAALPAAMTGLNDKLIVTSAIEPFSLYVKVSLYAALCLSVPFLLWQIWGFVAPGLYPHRARLRHSVYRCSRRSRSCWARRSPTR